MKIAVPKELHPNEKRVAIIPQTAKDLIKLGAEVEIEQGMGTGSKYSDEEYKQVGVGINSNRKNLLNSADIVLRLRKPPIEEIEWRLHGTIVCCIPGQLAYYYGESGEERLLLQR